MGEEQRGLVVAATFYLGAEPGMLLRSVGCNGVSSMIAAGIDDVKVGD